MTYGWAILIVIVVVAALYAMGVFKGGTTVACSPCFGGSDVAYVDHNAQSLVVRCGPRDLTINTTYNCPSGQQVNIDISACGWTNNECGVDLSYVVTETGLSHTTSATLRLQQ